MEGEAKRQDRTAILGKLVDSFLRRCRRGEKPSLDDFLDRYPELADDLEKLLEAIDAVEDLRAESTRERGGGSGWLTDVDPLQRLGDYRLLRQVGRGGMGIVYEAEQESLGRHVALKVLPFRAVKDSNLLDRFHREARAAAALNHPNIVPVFGVGEDQGVHYFAMQFIRGHPLDDILDEVRRLREARDAKRGVVAEPGPASRIAMNLISFGTESREAFSGPDTEAPEVVPEDTAGRQGDVKTPRSLSISTSGVASLSGFQFEYFRNVAHVAAQVADALAYAHGEGVLHRDIKPSNLLLDERGNVWVSDFGLAKAKDSERLTHPGDILGTVPYMAPERFRGWSDPRSDVYSLGITLYELVTLRPAFSDGDRARLIRRVTHEEPLRPRKLEPRLPRDLETIVLRAIDKEPARRYQQARELAGDLRRFIAEEPVRARRASRLECMARWARRRPTAAALIVVTCVAVASTLLGIVWYRALQSALKEVRRDRYTLEIRLAQHAWEAGNAVQVIDFLQNHIPVEGREDLRGFEWYYLWDRCHQSLRTLSGHRGTVNAVAYSSDERWLASAGSGGLIRIWSAASGEEWMTLGGDGHIQSVAFSPDATLLASGSADGTVTLWELETGKPVRLLERHSLGVNSVAFSADGKILASVAAGSRVPGRGELRLWEAPAWRARTRLSYPCGVNWVAFSPSGGMLAVASPGGVEILDADSATVLRRVDEPCARLAVSPDGKTVVTSSVSPPGTLRSWDCASGEKTWEFVSPARTPGFNPLAFSPCGRWLAAGLSKKVYLWPIEGGEGPGQPRILEGHSSTVTSLEFSPDGHTLASGSQDGTVKEWEVAERGPALALPAGGVVDSLSFSPDGTLLALGTRHGSVELWDLREFRLQATLEVDAPGLSFLPLVFSPEGNTLVSGSGRFGAPGEVKLWETRSGELRATREGLSGPVVCLALSPEGQLAAGGGPLDQPGELRIWSVSGDREADLQDLDSMVYSVAFSPDGASLAAGTREGQLVVWDALQWRVYHSLGGHGGAVSGMVYSPDGQLLISASLDGTVKVWDTFSGGLLKSFKPHRDAVWALTLSPDGRRLATGGSASDPTVRIWATVSWHELLSLEGHREAVTALAFSRDGRTLASGGGDRSLRLWRAPGLGRREPGRASAP